VWADRFQGSVGDVHEVREHIIRNVTSALELQIPLNEARRARMKRPEQLDAWSAYHLGLQHMWRFTKADNAVATGLFERALSLEPAFARAYAGLSFTHFQDAFLRYSGETSDEADRAFQYAEKSLELDPIDPFGNLTMGRAHWLRGDLEGSLPWLDRANTLNPNYAQAKYSRGWTEALLGRGVEGQSNVDVAMALSPLDPLLYGMLGVRAMSHIVLGEAANAALWGDRAARSPGAHVLIEMIAVAGHGLNNDEDRAKFWAQSARSRDASVTTTDFLQAFPFREDAVRKNIVKTLGKYGF
jgi:tetratricopeptide (TPR) repeat protein